MLLAYQDRCLQTNRFQFSDPGDTYFQLSAPCLVDKREISAKEYNLSIPNNILPKLVACLQSNDGMLPTLRRHIQGTSPSKSVQMWFQIFYSNCQILNILNIVKDGSDIVRFSTSVLIHLRVYFGFASLQIISIHSKYGNSLSEHTNALEHFRKIFVMGTPIRRGGGGGRGKIPHSMTVDVFKITKSGLKHSLYLKKLFENS